MRGYGRGEHCADRLRDFFGVGCDWGVGSCF